MPRLSENVINEDQLSVRQMAYNEEIAARYFQEVIRNGQAHQLLTDLNTLDSILRALGIQESDKDPIEMIQTLMQSK